RLMPTVQRSGPEEDESSRGGSGPGGPEAFCTPGGGHCCVLRFREETICKPLIPREHQFYKTLPTAMRKFTPQYRGKHLVCFQEDQEGNLCLFAHPLRNSPLDLENKDPSSDNDVHNLQEEVELDWLKESEVLHYRLECSHSNAAPQLTHNPWSLKCHQQHLQRMKENAKHRNQYKFILLENLTWRHTVPCVLDLKMGTRQHGDDASEEKKADHIRKCQQSTSATIGVRLGGMQVYQSDTDQLMFMNKYQGRKLTSAGFKEALFQFFHSGRRLRHELLSPVLRRLRDMKTALEDCESYRFFSSSLLIIYDGDEVTEALCFAHSPSTSCEASSSFSSCPKVDVRMIDFAHTTCKHYGDASVIHEGQDSGYIFGLQNLITIIAELAQTKTEK
uniref:Kinase n=1 Tax=Neogobius melanostomus TaxID=47308 RepID=A0A8C6TUW1_9GOBI